MKKILTCVMATLMAAALSLSACGGSGSGSGSNQEPTKAAETTSSGKKAETKAAATAAQTAEAAEEDNVFRAENFASGAIAEKGEWKFSITKMDMEEEGYFIYYTIDHGSIGGKVRANLSQLLVNGAGCNVMLDSLSDDNMPERDSDYFLIPANFLAMMDIQEVKSLKFTLFVNEGSKSRLEQACVLFPGAADETPYTLNVTDDMTVIVDDEDFQVVIITGYGFSNLEQYWQVFFNNKKGSNSFLFLDGLKLGDYEGKIQDSGISTRAATDRNGTSLPQVLEWRVIFSGAKTEGTDLTSGVVTGFVRNDDTGETKDVEYKVDLSRIEFR